MSSNYQKKPWLVECRNISVNLGDRQIIKNISLRIKKKQIITLVGPNGGGKTTLAKAIIGIVKLSSGRIIKNRNLTIGYVPQRFVPNALMPITAREFLNLGHEYDMDQFEQISNMLLLSNLLDKLLHQLSGGQLQKILLARALLRNPQLLILDEPTQGIDISGQFEFYNLIAELRKRNDMSIIMISHDLHVVMKSCDQVICLNQHICCSGHPNDISNDPEYTKIFNKEALESIGIYSHKHDHVHDAEGCIIK
jgi:zinc transport system ATP-binding protein